LPAESANEAARLFATPLSGGRNARSCLVGWTMTKLANLLDLKLRGDDRGSLVAIEGRRNIPFDIARVYYIFGTKPGVERGFHAHRRLDQYAISVSGSCTILLDDGTERLELRLDRPDQALRLGPMIWHEMRDFSPECVLMVVADDVYEESDYITSSSPPCAAETSLERTHSRSAGSLSRTSQ
jgi:dTDP-4-dehydrorhamnose 3,5-epimerase-like enzyme